MATSLQTDATGWVPTYNDEFDGGWMQFYTTWPNRYSGPHANGAFSFNPDFVQIDNGELTIRNALTANGWQSGGVDQGFAGQRYGHYEIRAMVEKGQGTSGAIILWPNAGVWPPEVDIMESPFADRSSTFFFYHAKDGTDGGQFPIDASQWHTYSLDWTPGKLVWSVDGKVLRETQPWEANLVPDQPMNVSLTGFIASPADTWWNGGPNASTPVVVNMHVDYVHISAMPLGMHDQLAPTLFNGAATVPAGLAVGPAAISGQLYAAAIYNGDWGGVATAQTAPASWGATYSDRMAWVGITQVQADLRSAGGTPLDIMLLDVKGGAISTGSGNDVVAWVALSDAPGTGNRMTIDTGAGNDSVRVGPAGWVGFDDGYIHSPTVNPYYEGTDSLAVVSLGSGDDLLSALGPLALLADGGAGDDNLSGANADDTLQGGAGDDTIDGGGGTNTAAFAGPRSGFTVTNSEGATVVADKAGTLGSDTLRNIAKLQFSDVTLDLASGTTTTTPLTPPPVEQPPPPPPPASNSQTLGTGPDTLVLKISQDAYQGSAQYTLAVDGVALGGTLTAVALHGSADDTLTLHGSWGSGQHTVTVTFLNDAWGGSGTADRNLFVDGISYNGTALADGSAGLFSEGPAAFSFGTTAPPASNSQTLGIGPDTLVLKISQDAYQGNAQYSVAVDGVALGGTLSAAAPHGSGDDTLTLHGSWGSGQHTVTVTFLNDAWGGSGTADRNLFVDGISYNGTALANGSAALFSEGPVSFGFGTAAPPPADVPLPANGGQLFQGTAQVDQLNGTAGNDVLIGGKGNDGMVGNGGADSFVLAAGDGPDWISDFAAGADKLVFSGIAPAAVAWHAAYYGVPGIEVVYGTDSVFLAGAWQLNTSDLVFI